MKLSSEEQRSLWTSVLMVVLANPSMNFGDRTGQSCARSAIDCADGVVRALGVRIPDDDED